MKYSFWSAVLLFGAVTLLAACNSKTGDRPAVDTAAKSSSDTAHSEGHHRGSKANETAAHTHSTKLVFSSAPSAIEPGKPAVWTLKIVEAKSGQPVPAFDLAHEKLLHLIVVSHDLSWFNHIHPEYKGNGVFTASATLPRSGEYVLYADYTPAGGEQEIARQEIATAGASSTVPIASLAPDAIGNGGWMVRTVGSAPEGMPEQSAGQYQVALMPMPASIKAGEDVMLHFQVRDSAGKPLGSLESYLGAMGHCVILSADSKIYLHAHPSDGAHSHGGSEGHSGIEHAAAASGAGGGAATGILAADAASAEPETKSRKRADVVFYTNFPLAGRYKIWGQFQYKGRIITVPFVVEVQ